MQLQSASDSLVKNVAHGLRFQKAARLDRERQLRALAGKINELGTRYEDAHKAFCIALADAQKELKKHSGMSMKEFTDRYLRKKDGSKWSYDTILNYCSLGRRPAEVDKNRARIRQANITRMAGPTYWPTTVATQVTFLETAWERATDQARKLFMSNHNLRVMGKK